MKHICSALLFVCGSLATCQVANATDSEVPQPFREFDATSVYVIDYSDLNALLGSLVVDVGRSDRGIGQSVVAKTGTRMKNVVNNSTVNEGNRFFYELFEDNEENQKVLGSIQNDIEQIPGEVPLAKFPRDEQLAYWLNLYNITILNEVVQVYPQKKLNKLLLGKNSILSKKLLMVAGVPLSLNDIQFTILKQNYENNPLIMYGLYQGIIGGPNIRRRAYTGENVYRDLEDNAIEFINSNRGTDGKKSKAFRVSSLYQRNEVYFDDSELNLTDHLLRYLEGDERGELQVAKTVKPDINDWAVTDLFGTHSETGGSIASNSAALMGSVRGSGSSSNASGALIAKSPSMSRYSPEMLKNLYRLKEKQEAVKQGKATVTVEELGQVPVEAAEG
jgi:hypothetical protein